MVYNLQMNGALVSCKRLAVRVYQMVLNPRMYSDSRYEDIYNAFHNPDEPLICSWKLESDVSEDEDSAPYCGRKQFVQNSKINAARVLDILRQDGPGYDTKSALDELHITISGLLVREVLFHILKTIDDEKKTRYAKIGFKFFVWSGQQANYRHTTTSYHLILKIFAVCEEFRSMWRLVDEMTENGLCITARTFNILICTCCEAGLGKKVVERFIKSKSFNYRPFRHSYNAILHSLLSVRQYGLIEWVYEQMLGDGYSADTLTYNILMYSKYRLGKLSQFHSLLDKMGKSGLNPDFHTYNILLHVLGKGDKPLAALTLMNHMKEEGIDPCVLHYTTVIDGLSRAGNFDACKYFYDEMIKYGCVPDVVCYTVMISVFVVAGELENAQTMFTNMIGEGKLPNAFTYNSLIRGFCREGRFSEACLMLKEMESRGCEPNYLVYSRLVSSLRKAGKLAEAHQILRQMVEKGRYAHLASKVSKFK